MKTNEEKRGKRVEEVRRGCGNHPGPNNPGPLPSHPGAGKVGDESEEQASPICSSGPKLCSQHPRPIGVKSTSGTHFRPGLSLHWNGGGTGGCLSPGEAPARLGITNGFLQEQTPQVQPSLGVISPAGNWEERLEATISAEVPRPRGLVWQKGRGMAGNRGCPDHGGGASGTRMGAWAFPRGHWRATGSL